MIIIIIILIIIYIYWFWSKKTINQDTDGIQGFKDYKNQRISCNKNIIINDRLEEHISDVNNSAENMNTLHPTGVLPYNLNKTDDYNILNNYGIKNQRKREAYTLKFNGCAIIPHNSQKLLKNYDSVLDESFKTIEIPRWKNYTATQSNSNKEDPPKILLLLGDGERDVRSVRWSYPQKDLCNRKIYLYYKFNKDSNYNSLLLNNKLDNNEFKLTVSQFKERNIYKLDYNLSKTVKLKVGLKENNKLIVDSNSVFI